MVLLDWTKTGSAGTPEPCVICDRPAITRSPNRKPCHKMCAESWTDTHGRRPAEPEASRVDRLLSEQLSGWACVVCGESPRQMVPVGSVEGHGQVFACTRHDPDVCAAYVARLRLVGGGDR
jgi:hypothetical protein